MYYPGGGSQLNFVDNKDWSNARPNKYNENVENPKLKIIGVKKI